MNIRAILNNGKEADNHYLPTLHDSKFHIDVGLG